MSSQRRLETILGHCNETSLHSRSDLNKNSVRLVNCQGENGEGAGRSSTGVRRVEGTERDGPRIPKRRLQISRFMLLHITIMSFCYLVTIMNIFRSIDFRI